MHNYNYDVLIERTQSIIRALRQKAKSTDDSQVLKISNVYTIQYSNNIALGSTDTYAVWHLELPRTDFLYTNDVINAFSEKSYVYGHIYGLRNKSDYEEALNKNVYQLEDVNSSPAQTIELTETHNHNLNEGEYHWYKFTAPSTGFYDFFTEGQNIDTFGELFNNEVVAQSTIGCIQYDDDSGVGKNFNIHRKLDVGQTIYIRVRGYGWSKQGNYSFKVRKTPGRTEYSANARDFSSFVNSNGQGQYFFYEKQQALELGGLNVNTKRLRCGFIENNYLVLSAYRQNAGTAYLELNFEEQLKSISFNIGLWGNIEKIDSTNSTVLLQYKNTSGEWVTIIDFMKVGLASGVYSSEFYLPLDVYDTKDVRIIVNVTNPAGSQNRGRVMLDNFKFGI